MLALLALAQAAPLAGVRIEGVGALSEDGVLESMQLRAGAEATVGAVRRDLKALWATGLFADVRILQEGDVLVVQVVENPRLVELRVEGVRKLSDEDLEPVLSERPTLYVRRDIVRRIRLLKDIYAAKGFLLADVVEDRTAVADGAVSVVLRVDERKKVLVDRVDIIGTSLPTGPIERQLATREGGIAPWLTETGVLRREELDRDRQRIVGALREEGYVDAEVAPARVFLTPDRRRLLVSFAVEEGRRYDLGRVRFGGELIPDLGLGDVAVETELSVLNTGEPFRQSTLDDVVAGIEAMYGDQGYGRALVLYDLDRDPDEGVVDIELDITAGPRLTVGRIDIEGNAPSTDRTIRRRLLQSEGSRFHRWELEASREALLRTGWFEDVSVEVVPRAADEEVVDVVIGVEEGPSGRIQANLGFSSLETAAGGFEIMESNFVGLGLGLEAMGRASFLRSDLRLGLTEPRLGGSKWSLSVVGQSAARAFNLDEFERGGSVTVGRGFGWDDSVRLKLGYTLQEVGLRNVSADRLRLFGGALFRGGLTSSVTGTLEIDRRDRPDARRGGYAAARLTYTGGGLGGDFDTVEGRLNARYFQPLGGPKLVLRSNASAAHIVPLDGQLVPFLSRFRGGGIQSVRGFVPYSLGPRVSVAGSDPTGVPESLVIGGVSSLIANVELESHFAEQAGVSGVVFFDVGNTFDPAFDAPVSFGDLRTSVGFGLRWRGPLGLLRFEYGIPLKPLPDERRGILEFTVGTSF